MYYVQQAEFKMGSASIVAGIKLTLTASLFSLRNASTEDVHLSEAMVTLEAVMAWRSRLANHY